MDTEASQVDIIIPCYNAERRIGACLDALINQAYPDWRALVVDDGSEDETAEVIEQYAQKDKRIQPVYLTENVGRGPARQAGLEKANSPVIAFTDADCEPLENWLETMLETMAEHPDIGGVTGAVINGNRSLAGWLDYLSNFASHSPSLDEHRRGLMPMLNCAYRGELLEGLTFTKRMRQDDVVMSLLARDNENHFLYHPDLLVRHNPDVQSLKRYFQRQWAYGEGFARAKLLFDFRSSYLCRFPGCLLLLVLPRLWMGIRRIGLHRYLLMYLLLFPLLFAGEIVRTFAVFATMPCVDQTDHSGFVHTGEGSHELKD